MARIGLKRRRINFHCENTFLVLTIHVSTPVLKLLARTEICFYKVQHFYLSSPQ